MIHDLRIIYSPMLWNKILQRTRENADKQFLKGALSRFIVNEPIYIYIYVPTFFNFAYEKLLTSQ